MHNMMATPPTSRTPTPTATTAPAHPSAYSDTYYQLPRTPTSTSFKSSSTSTRLPRRQSQSQSQSHALQKIDRKVESRDVVQGRILWLPSKEDLPERAVRRAHGKGAIEEGIYNHPIVVVSRPGEGNEGEGGCVHFCLITSFQGKRLHEIYNKANEFHASRRSWYLPISPTPSHPDASSKKSRKRFPTLDLANNATLRWDSYVNIRHVYKLDWSYLKPYANPNTPENQVFRFERDSLVQLLAKSRVLTLYEPGPQFQNGNGGLNSNSNSRQNTTVSIPRSYSSPTASATTSPILERGYDRTGRPGAHDQFPQSPVSDTASIADSEYSATSALLQSDFSDSKSTRERSPGPPRKAPPDRNRGHGQNQNQNQNQEPDEGVVSRGIARQDSCSSVEEGADCGCIGYVIKRLLCCRPGGHGQP